MERLTLTVDEAADVTGFGRRKVYELCRQPESDFPAIRVGRRIVIGKAALEEWLMQRREIN